MSIAPLGENLNLPEVERSEGGARERVCDRFGTLAPEIVVAKIEVDDTRTGERSGNLFRAVNAETAPLEMKLGHITPDRHKATHAGAECHNTLR